MITTPDFGSFLAKVMKSRWFHVRPLEHLYYFDQQTMDKMPKKEGFDIVFIKPYQRYRDVNSLIRYVPMLKIFHSLLNKIMVNGVKLYLNDEMIVLARKR